jgi:hypothetical protein
MNTLINIGEKIGRMGTIVNPIINCFIAIPQIPSQMWTIIHEKN